MRCRLGIVRLVVFFAGCSSVQPDDIGFKSGKFSECSSKPNCVSSTALDSDHKIDPISSDLLPEEAIVQVATMVKGEPGGAVIMQDRNYLYAQFTSSLMGFVDDVEFYKNGQQEPIQIRSASRVGYSDLGVNRKRLEKFRARFAKRK